MVLDMLKVILSCISFSVAIWSFALWRKWPFAATTISPIHYFFGVIFLIIAYQIFWDAQKGHSWLFTGISFAVVLGCVEVMFWLDDKLYARFGSDIDESE